MKYKKAVLDQGVMTIIGIVLTAMILGAVALAVIPGIRQQIKAFCLYPGVGGCVAEAGEIEGQEEGIGEEKDKKEEIKGEIQAPILLKKDDKIFTFPKPTSDEHCSVTIKIKNTGEKTWEESDMIRAALYCKQNKDQVEISPKIAPPIGYIVGLAPGEERILSFLDWCLLSSEEYVLPIYYIKLYANCIGDGKEKVCGNLDDTYSLPIVLSQREFMC